MDVHADYPSVERVEISRVAVKHVPSSRHHPLSLSHASIWQSSPLNCHIQADQSGLFAGSASLQASSCCTVCLLMRELFI